VVPDNHLSEVHCLATNFSRFRILVENGPAPDFSGLRNLSRNAVLNARGLCIVDRAVSNVMFEFVSRVGKLESFFQNSEISPNRQINTVLPSNLAENGFTVSLEKSSGFGQLGSGTGMEVANIGTEFDAKRKLSTISSFAIQLREVSLPDRTAVNCNAGSVSKRLLGECERESL
jgi:hypothetical protein